MTLRTLLACTTLLLPLVPLASAEPCGRVYCGPDPMELAWFATHDSDESVELVADAYLYAAGVLTGVACDSHVRYDAWIEPSADAQAGLTCALP